MDLDLEKLQAAIDALKVEKAALARERKAIEGLKEVVQLNLERCADRVKLNVGGTRFETTLSTLQRHPDSMLGTMFSGREGIKVHVDDDGYVFIDRSGEHFHIILDYLRTDELDEPPDARAMRALERELKFYMLEPPRPVSMRPQSGFTREEVKQFLYDGKSLSRMDLRGLDLSGLRFGHRSKNDDGSDGYAGGRPIGGSDEVTLWKGANFAGANLTGTWFSGAPLIDLRSACSPHAYGGFALVHAFQGCDLSHARIPLVIFAVLTKDQQRQPGLTVRVPKPRHGGSIWQSASSIDDGLELFSADESLEDATNHNAYKELLDQVARARSV